MRISKLPINSVLSFVCLFSLAIYSQAGELDEEVHKWGLKVVDDIETELLDCLVNYDCVLETSEDSNSHFSGECKSFCFYSKEPRYDYLGGEWKFRQITTPKTPRSQDSFGTRDYQCKRIVLDGREFEVGDRFARNSPEHSFVHPFSWLTMIPVYLSTYSDNSEAFHNLFGSHHQVVKSTEGERVASYWIGKKTHADGLHRGFKYVEFEDKLPVVVKHLSYQKGFSGDQIPSFDECYEVSRISISWTRFNNTSVPKTVTGVMFDEYDAEIKSAKFEIKYEYLEKDSEDFKQFKDRTIRLFENARRLRVPGK